MKALILHGYGQSKDIAINKWDKTFKKIGIIPYYLDAPLEVINKKGDKAKGWFAWESADDSIYESKKYVGVGDTLEYINSYIKSEGSFDIIIGYSQGGTIASILIDNIQKLPIYLIIVSAYEPLDEKYRIKHLPNCKTLVIVSNNDEVVPKEKTLSIYNKFDEFKNKIEIYEHNNYHNMPSDRKFVNFIKEWLK